MKEFLRVGVVWAVLVGTLLNGFGNVTAASGRTPIKVIVNGKLVKFDVQPYEDWNAGGRLVVQVRPVVNAMGCKKTEFDSKTGTVRIYDICGNGHMATYLEMNPRTESHLHYVRNGWQPGDGPVPYLIDVPAKILRGHTVTSARLLGDAFDCYTWWNDLERSMNFNCSRPAQLHENLEVVMNRYSPKLEGINFVLPPTDEIYHMYPSTQKAYAAVVDTANGYLALLKRRTARSLEIAYEPAFNRARVWHREENRTFAYVKGDMVVIPGLSVGEAGRLSYRLKVDTHVESAFVAISLGLVALIPGVGEVALANTFLSAVTVVASAGVRESKGELDESTIDQCIEEAKDVARKKNEPEENAKITIAKRFGRVLRCIPWDTKEADYSWQTFGELGVASGIW